MICEPEHNQQRSIWLEKYHQAQPGACSSTSLRTHKESISGPAINTL